MKKKRRLSSFQESGYWTIREILQWCRSTTTLSQKEKEEIRESAKKLKQLISHPPAHKEKKVYKYKIGGKIREFSEPLFFYYWRINDKSTVFFGMYTKTAFNAKKTLDEFNHPEDMFTDISSQPLLEEESSSHKIS